MIYFLDLFTVAAALICLFGMVGDKDAGTKPYYTAGFVACMCAIIILNK